MGLMVMTTLRRILTAGTIGALALTLSAGLAGTASAATFLNDNMGTLNANQSLSDSIVLTWTAPTNGHNGKLGYDFGVQSAHTLTGLSAGGNAIDLTFTFKVVGQALTLVQADAINPIGIKKLALGGAPYIFLEDVTTSTQVTPNEFFSPITIPKGFGAVTDQITLQPGTYTETIIGTLAQGTTDLNVGAFAGPAVPEPATWSMILFGLGLIGGGLRLARRRDDAALPAA
jgi:hypothetical protein